MARGGARFLNRRNYYKFKVCVSLFFGEVEIVIFGVMCYELYEFVLIFFCFYYVLCFDVVRFIVDEFRVDVYCVYFFFFVV